MSIHTTVEFLSTVLAAADMGGSRGRLDMFADRLVKAASAPALSAAMEHLLRAVNASADKLHPPLVTRMLGIAAGPDGPRILRWWREQAKLVALLAGTRDQAIVDETIATLTLPDACSGSAAKPRGEFMIGMQVECESPLSHGSDGKAGNATLLRRMQVLTAGGVLTLPYYAGNALRGQVRDLLANHLLASLGIPASRSTPAIAMWLFYALYSGGALEESSDATKALRKELGDHGAIRAQGIGQFRAMLPALSLLGCALGNRVLAGRCQFADLRPVCAEWGTGARPVAELTAWEYLTRREDHEDHLVHHGMIANTEVLRAGTALEGGVDHDDAIGALELSALGKGLSLLATRGMLGAENRRGMGKVSMQLSNLPDSSAYEQFLADNKPAILDYLQQVGAVNA